MYYPAKHITGFIVSSVTCCPLWMLWKIKYCNILLDSCHTVTEKKNWLRDDHLNLFTASRTLCMVPLPFQELTSHALGFIAHSVPPVISSHVNTHCPTFLKNTLIRRLIFQISKKTSLSFSCWAAINRRLNPHAVSISSVWKDFIYSLKCNHNIVQRSDEMDVCYKLLLKSAREGGTVV